MPQQDSPDTRQKLLTMLLERVDEEPFPSSTHLDLIEEMLTQEDVPRYVDVLMRKVSSETYPSLAMLDRIKALA